MPSSLQGEITALELDRPSSQSSQRSCAPRPLPRSMNELQ